MKTRQTVKEPPAGALLASKKKKAKPVTKVKKRCKKNLEQILVKRVTVEEPPSGALLASKNNKAKPVPKVQKRIKKHKEFP
jgi:hypothetical protein